MTCFPTNPLDVFTIYSEVYGIPSLYILGFILGIINAMIYAHSRSVSMLAITGIYTIAALAAIGVTTSNPANATITPFIIMAEYLVIFAIATTILIFVLKVLRE